MTTKTEEQIRKEIDSIDWEAIDRLNLVEGIGCELYHQARAIEDLGYEKTVATVAAIMDGFRAHHSHRLDSDVKRGVSNGFAQAVMRSVVATLEDEETV